MATSRKKKIQKTEALLASIVVHAILAVLAVTLVAFSVVVKEDQQFEGKPISRPQVALKKLKIPVNIRKAPKPRLRKNIVVKHKIRNTPDIKMPEIIGVKGGFSSAGSGLGGGAASLGFSMPELDMFGVKSNGEKIFLVLDSTEPMMRDDRGGLESYDLIKQEIYHMLEGLNSTVLFNIAAYDWQNGQMLFPKMVMATPSNIEKVKAWLDPLNRDKGAGGDLAVVGTKTAGPGGKTFQSKSLTNEIMDSIDVWVGPAMLAMQQQADTVYILAATHRNLGSTERTTPKGWSESKQKKWEELYEKAKLKLAEENEQRRSEGIAPLVIGMNPWSLIERYFPTAEKPPPSTSAHYYTTKDIKKALDLMRKQSAKAAPSIGLKKKKNSYTVNVIHFVPQNDTDMNDAEKFKNLASICRGEYRQLQGLDAITAAAYQ